MTRANWVFACGMRRSGSTVQYHLTREIVNLAGGLDLGWVIWQDFDRLYDEHFMDDKYIVLKCHTYMPERTTKCGAAWDNRECYGVFIHRDIRDVCASIIRKRIAADNPTFAELKRIMKTTALDEGKRWYNTSRVLTSRYEDILSVGGLANECARIGKHLGIDVTRSQCLEIANRHTLDAQRARIPTVGERYNKKYLLWYNHIFTGENMTWKKELPRNLVVVCNELETLLPPGMRR